MKLNLLLIGFLIAFNLSHAQDISENISYIRIYDFMDELAGDKLIDLKSAIQPYSRKLISEKLLEAQSKDANLNARQKAELKFFLNEFILEQDKLPDTKINLWKNEISSLALVQPAFHYRDSLFRARITPILGMHVSLNNHGSYIKRWFGADFQVMIGKHFSIYGSLRDISNEVDSGLIAKPKYLNDFPGYEYKEATYGGDFSDSRGGIKYSNNWGSIGLIKDNVIWGDNYHGSNILSGRAPSFPMLTLNLKPAKWFEFNYFHAWLVSNVVDSSYYYLENDSRLYYRPANKFMAANMFTFTPVNGLKISVGNAIVYAEKTIQGSYFIPFAFYKSIDHTLTKGIGTENQNSQMFLNISSRNIKHLHLYGSVFIDEMNFSRFKASNPENNPISIKVGAQVSNLKVQNLTAIFEYTRSNILNYKHSIPLLTWESNSYNLGHYLGDNAQEIYMALKYKPIRGLDFKLSYFNAQKANDYDYIRRGTSNGLTGSVLNIISQAVLDEIIWKNQTLNLNVCYEIFNNAYAVLQIENSNISAYEPVKAATFGENRMTANQTLNYFTPKFYQGKNTTVTAGFSIGF